MRFHIFILSTLSTSLHASFIGVEASAMDIPTLEELAESDRGKEINVGRLTSGTYVYSYPDTFSLALASNVPVGRSQFCEDVFMDFAPLSFNGKSALSALKGMNYVRCSTPLSRFDPQLLAWQIEHKVIDRKKPGDNRKALVCAFYLNDDRIFSAMRLGSERNVGHDAAEQQLVCRNMLLVMVRLQNAFDNKDAWASDIDELPTDDTQLSDHLGQAQIIRTRGGFHPSVEVLSQAYLREECTEKFTSFDPDSFDVGKVKPVLVAANYVRCDPPRKDGSYDYAGLYRIDRKLETTKDHHKLLTCTFTEILTTQDPDSEEAELEIEDGRQFTASRQTHSKTLMSRPTDMLSNKMRNRIRTGDNRSAEAELMECLAMLESFIRIQNGFTQEYYKGTGEDYSDLLMAGIGPGSRASRKPESGEASGGIGVGYIIIIVVGALVLIAGGFYAYKKASGATSAAPKAKRTRRSKKGKSTRAGDEEGQGGASDEEGSERANSGGDETIAAQSKSLIQTH